jgi:N-acetylglucosaminyl-diphospho-decaprenol L-rhamnosyltransferase
LPDLSIVIVSWNVEALLRRCLRSIVGDSRPQAAADLTMPGTSWSYEVWVVDNASTDGSVGMVRREFPFVRLITNSENLGFAAANNQAIAESKGDYLLLLNCDTELVGNAMGTMLGYMEEHSDVGMLGPMLRYPDGTLQSSRRRFPTMATAYLESTVLQQWFPQSHILRRYYLADVPDDTTQEVDWVVGACMMTRRQIVEQVGVLDDGFFMYSEELDWCYRIKQSGWSVVYLPAAEVVHHEGRSSEQVVPARHIHFQSSKVRFFRKHHGLARAELLRFFLLATYVFQLCEEAVKWALGHKRELRAERVRAYWQVLRSGLVGKREEGGAKSA